jgi:hypothetical protein
VKRLRLGSAAGKPWYQSERQPHEGRESKRIQGNSFLNETVSFDGQLSPLHVKAGAKIINYLNEDYHP